MTTNSTWQNQIEKKKQYTPTTKPHQETINDYLLDDKELAESLNDVIKHWTKHISDWEWWSIIVPDYHLRLKWLDIELKIKWHYREKRIKDDEIDWIYTLVD